MKEAYAYDPQNRLKEVEITNDDRSSSDTKFDPNNIHPYNELDIAKAPDGKVTGAEIVLDQTVGGSIGQIFGSALGSALGGKDQLSRLVNGVVGGTIGALIGQKFVQVLATSMNADLSKVSVTDVFSGQGLADAGLGAVSSFLTAELGNALKIPGFGGQLFNAATNSFTLGVFAQVKTSIQAGLTFDAAIAAIDWSAAVSGAIGSAGLQVPNLLGTFLGQLLVPAKSHAGEIGGQLLGAIGSFLLPGVGSLIGQILGTVIGDLFGHTSHPAATDLLDQAGDHYAATHYQTSSSDGGAFSVPDQLADPALAIINGYLKAVNGAVLDHSKQVTIGYQTAPQSSYIVGDPSHPAAGVFYATGFAVQAAAVGVLQHTEVIGGDLLLKRGHHNSSFYNPPPMPPADPSGDPGPAGAPIQPIATTQLAILSADLAVAQDYENYLNNREAINALMAANPNSAFTAGWIATFARVNELKLNQVTTSDFLGGLVGYLDSVNKAGLGAVASNVSVSHGGAGDSVITVAIKVPNGAEVPGSLAAFADVTSVSSDATGQTVQLQFGGNLMAGGFQRLGATATGGNGVNDLWFGGDGGQNFNGSGGHDILVGGSGNDVIHGGPGWDFVQGGAGGDRLYGDDGNDILNGGAGSDLLDGGAGTDTAVYGAAFGGYTLVSYNGVVGVLSHGGDGGDRLLGIENIQFTDRTVAAVSVAAFDPWEYLASNTALIAVYGPIPQKGYDQYVDIGFNEGRATNTFDRLEYLASNPDTIAAGWTLATAAQHYVTYGFFEHRATASFDPVEYLASNPDLIAAGYNAASAARHYVSYGYAQGRATRSFDPLEYLASNPDLIAAGITPASAAQHYLTSGIFAHRPTASFDPLEYLASNPDMIAAGWTPATAAQHYVTYGVSEHRATSAFHPEQYFAANPDLAPAGWTLATAAQHYVTYGYSEHRATTSVHSPLITSDGGGSLASIAVAENSIAVTTLAASDPDPGTTLTYSIAGGADQFLFHLDSSTHALSFVTAPNFEAPADADRDGNYVVQVQASDGVLTATQTITVNVTDVIERFKAAGDFDGDGRSDILWQRADGQPAEWLMNGLASTGGGLIGFNPGPNMHAIGSGDFNGDGRDDILWQGSDGTPAMWLMNGTNIIGGGLIGFNPGPNMHAIATGDFNGDGKADILWQGSDGTPAMWLMNGTSMIGGGLIGSNPGANMHAVATGDFNGDGNADILWQGSDGAPAIWLMNGTSIIGGGMIGFNPGANMHAVATGDFNGDGHADILWQGSDGAPAVWLMNGLNMIGGGMIGFNPGPAMHAVATGDFNADGHADILWHGNDGTPAMWLMNGLNIASGGLIGFNPGADWHIVG